MKLSKKEKNLLYDIIEFYWTNQSFPVTEHTHSNEVYAVWEKMKTNER